MTQKQYDTAKDIILDLLGWGVPSEYLVSCGISREIVYYAFIDFNLRHPDSLDTSGLPSITELAELATKFVAKRNRQRTRSPSRSRPPQFPVADVPREANPSGDGLIQPSHLSPSAPPFVPGSSIPETSAYLHDMEQMRRRELLARKAVQASRKAKQPEVSDPRAMYDQHYGPRPDVDFAKHVAPSMAVDDFLNSIEPGRDNSREGSKAPVSRMNSLDDMDIDGPPGLSVEITSARSAPPRRNDVVFRPSSVSDITPPVTATNSSASVVTVGRQPSPLQRTDTEKVLPTSSGSGSSSSGSMTPPVPRPSAPTRRGTKRPVAADFVDMEPVFGRSSNGYATPQSIQHHHHTHHHHGPGKKRSAGFAAVSSKHRRMVIDLTDSEDDEDDSSAPPRATSVRAAAQTPVNKQSELAEHERAIRDLKEKIARKELEARLKKEAAVRFIYRTCGGWLNTLPCSWHLGEERRQIPMVHSLLHTS